MIVQIFSRAGTKAGIGNGIHASEQICIGGMSEALKQEIEPFGIKVLFVAPGALRTEFFGTSVRYTKKNYHFMRKLENIRANTKNLNGKQSGNPVKAAQIILDAVNQGAPTSRLPLTSGTIGNNENKD